MRVAYELKMTEEEVRSMPVEQFSRWVGFILLEDEKQAKVNKARGF